MAACILICKTHLANALREMSFFYFKLKGTFIHFIHIHQLVAINNLSSTSYKDYRPNTSTTMFEARLTQGKVFKQLIEALKDLVQEANIDCSDDEISIQAMDNSHVALVAVSLRSGGFDHFRCDRPISLGFNATNMGKILKCAGNDDMITLKAKDDGDALELVFESPGQDRIADFGEFAIMYIFVFYECMNGGVWLLE